TRNHFGSHTVSNNIEPDGPFFVYVPFSCRPWRGDLMRFDSFSLSAGVAWRISLGRRSLRYREPFADRARWFASGLVLARLALTIFSTNLHRAANRTRALGSESDRLPLDQHIVTCRQCLSRLGSPRPLKRSGGLAGRCRFCIASGAGRISSLDLRAQERADGIFFPSPALGLD